MKEEKMFDAGKPNQKDMETLKSTLQDLIAGRRATVEQLRTALSEDEELRSSRVHFWEVGRRHLDEAGHGTVADEAGRKATEEYYNAEQFRRILSFFDGISGDKLVTDVIKEKGWE